MSKSSITINESVSDGLRPTHPGEILGEEIRERGMSVSAFARAIHLDPSRVAAIVRGERAITADTALRLARYLGTSAEMWMALQTRYELKRAVAASGAAICAAIQPAA